MDALEIKTRREALGLSQTSFAAYFGVSQNTVARWESGARTPNDPVTFSMRIALLEDAFTDLVGQLIEIGESEEDLTDSPDVTFTVYGSDADFAAAEPALAAAGVTASMHRMAVGQARLELQAGDMFVRIVGE